MEAHAINIEYTCRDLQFAVLLTWFLVQLQLLSTGISMDTLTSYVLN